MTDRKWHLILTVDSPLEVTAPSQPATEIIGHHQSSLHSAVFLFPTKNHDKNKITKSFSLNFAVKLH